MRHREGMRLPFERIRARLAAHVPKPIDDPTLRRAAVATVLREGAGGAEVLLIRRADHPSDPWSGHMAFPGGRHDPHDPSLLATALRETAEEVGLDLVNEGELLGRLDDLEAVARGRRMGLAIAPFVFTTRAADPPLAPDPTEVAEAVWAPLEPMVRGDLRATFHYPWEGQTLALPAFDVGGRIVWGLTYQMLQSLFRVLEAG